MLGRDKEIAQSNNQTKSFEGDEKIVNSIHSYI